MATERHESRRIDNQLRGRSGRQGDPGASRFYLSLDDQLMRIFAGDRVRAIMDRLKMPEGEAIEAGIVNRSIESAQRKVEARNFDIRKQLLEYDDVSNDQRKVIYQQRNEILEAANLDEQIGNLRQSAMTEVVRTYVPAETLEEQWDLAGLERVLKDEWQLEVDLKGEVEKSESITDQDIVDKVVAAADAHFKAKVDYVGAEQFTPFMRMVLLQSIDSHWREHLAALDYLRQGIHLRGYAQKNPKQEYKREAFELFSQLLDVVKMEVTRTLMTVRIQSQDEAAQAAAALEEQAGAAVQRHLHGTHRGRRRVTGGRHRPAGRGAGAQGRAQRPLPLRQRQEVQAVPRQAGLRAVGGGGHGAPVANPPRRGGVLRFGISAGALPTIRGSAHPHHADAMPVNLSAPDPAVAARRAGRRASAWRWPACASRTGATWCCSRWTRALPWPASSPATASAPRRCSCAASTWRWAPASAPCSSTPATPTPAPAPTAWRGRDAVAPRWPRSWAWTRSRCCPSPPA